jgi:hypothetical protein
MDGIIDAATDKVLSVPIETYFKEDATDMEA